VRDYFQAHLRGGCHGRGGEREERKEKGGREGHTRLFHFASTPPYASRLPPHYSLGGKSLPPGGAERKNPSPVSIGGLKGDPVLVVGRW